MFNHPVQTEVLQNMSPQLIAESSVAIIFNSSITASHRTSLSSMSTRSNEINLAFCTSVCRHSSERTDSKIFVCSVAAEYDRICKQRSSIELHKRTNLSDVMCTLAFDKIRWISNLYILIMTLFLYPLLHFIFRARPKWYKIRDTFNHTFLSQMQEWILLPGCCCLRTLHFQPRDGGIHCDICILHQD